MFAPSAFSIGDFLARFAILNLVAVFLTWKRLTKKERGECLLWPKLGNDVHSFDVQPKHTPWSFPQVDA